MKALKILILALVVFTTLIGMKSRAESNPTKLKVIFFLDPECPISNAYMSEIKKIQAAYAGKGVAFEAVFPMQTITDQEISGFLKKYNATLPGSKDPGLAKSKRYQATVMPEVVVVNALGMTIYKGSIDNWYYALGKSRPKATELYLRNALDSVLNGNPVQISRTEAFGCLINL